MAQKNGKSGGTHGRLLSASDLLSGGDNRLQRIDIPEIVVNGEPGYVMHLPLTSRMVVDFISVSANKEGTDVSPEAQNEAVLRIMADTLCDEEGVLLYSHDDIVKMKDLRMSVFNRISTAIMAEIGQASDVAKNALGETVVTAPNGASSTVSPTA